MGHGLVLLALVARCVQELQVVQAAGAAVFGRHDVVDVSARAVVRVVEEAATPRANQAIPVDTGRDGRVAPVSVSAALEVSLAVLVEECTWVGDVPQALLLSDSVGMSCAPAPSLLPFVPADLLGVRLAPSALLLPFA